MSVQYVRIVKGLEWNLGKFTYSIRRGNKWLFLPKDQAIQWTENYRNRSWFFRFRAQKVATDNSLTVLPELPEGYVVTMEKTEKGFIIKAEKKGSPTLYLQANLALVNNQGNLLYIPKAKAEEIVACYS